MTTALAHTRYMTWRHLLALWRQPWYLAVTLVQPVIWLLLFGALFKRVVEIPGFGGGDYIAFLTPGVVIMTAIFGAGWTGMGVIQDIDRGVLDRFLVSPVRHEALILGRLAQLSIGTEIQSLIIVALGIATGASFPGGVAGVAVLIACAVLLNTAIGALSIGLALLARKEETLIGVVNFIVLPLTFLSAAFMKLSLAPHWIRDAARYNPVNWAVEAGREALGANVDWGFVGARVGLLAGLAVVCVWLATRALGVYQRAV
jgi:ABC-2 type transport system permease protein